MLETVGADNGNGNFDQRPQRRQPDDTARDPYAWTTTKMVAMGLIGLALTIILGVGLYSVGCHDKACYDTLTAVSVARANASTGVPTDVDGSGVITACTGECWNAQKVKEVAKANARAGFGSNSGTDTVTAVSRPNNIAAPASQPNVVAPQRTCGSNCAGSAKPTHLGEAACQRVGGVRYELHAASGFHRCYNAQGQRLSPSGSVIASQ
jgi:hypothetical protein